MARSFNIAGRGVPFTGLVVLGAITALLVASPARAPAVASAAPDAVPGELIVGFERAAGAASRADALAGVATASSRPLPIPRTRLVELDGGESVNSSIEALESAPGVSYAEPNFIRTLRATPNDPSFGNLWGLRSIHAPLAWNQTTGSGGVAIAVADDGVQTNHPDLTPNILPGWDFAADDDAPLPEAEQSGRMSPHGTHVAGTIGAQGNNGIGITGVNWDVGIIPLRIFGRNGTTTTDRIVRAFAYAGRHGAVALNASFGGSTSARAEREAIAAWPDTLFVVAAPNERINIDVYPDFPCGYELENIVCVSASDRQGRLARFAAFGKHNVDIVAPGVNILSTVPGGYEAMTGTSMSAPHVAGAIGLIAAAHPGLATAGIRDALLDSAQRTRRLRRRTANGRLDINAALAAADSPEAGR